MAPFRHVTPRGFEGQGSGWIRLDQPTGNRDAERLQDSQREEPELHFSMVAAPPRPTRPGGSRRRLTGRGHAVAGGRAHGDRGRDRPVARPSAARSPNGRWVASSGACLRSTVAREKRPPPRRGYRQRGRVDVDALALIGDARGYLGSSIRKAWSRWSRCSPGAGSTTTSGCLPPASPTSRSTRCSPIPEPARAGAR
jgi:hypothetical protein